MLEDHRPNLQIPFGRILVKFEWVITMVYAMEALKKLFLKTFRQKTHKVNDPNLKDPKEIIIKTSQNLYGNLELVMAESPLDIWSFLTLYSP